MSDPVGWALFISAIVGVTYACLSDPAAPHQRHMERRLARLMLEFPQATDEQVATLAHDELISQRVTAPGAVAWCTAEHVARVRRNIVLSRFRSMP